MELLESVLRGKQDKDRGFFGRSYSYLFLCGVFIESENGGDLVGRVGRKRMRLFMNTKGF